MKCRVLAAAAAISWSVVLASSPVLAGCGAGEKSAGAAPDAAMMEAWMKAMTPGEQHKNLNFFVGEWNTENTMWMEGTQMVSKGKMHCEPALGGRYFISKHTGDMNGMPFEGMGVDGYDNVNGEYFSTWYDNMGTGVMVSKGTASADMKSYTYTGATKDCMTGKMIQHKMVSTITGPDSYKFEMWMTPAGEKESKAMEMVLTRANKS